MVRPHIDMYTDGACIGNPGPGGYGVVLLAKDTRQELAVGYKRTTNNRMEIRAVIAGLAALPQASDVTLYSDSQYVVNSITKGWAVGWRAKGWRRNGNEAVPNADLWHELLILCERHHVTCTWVRGHDGNPENERCDYLSVQAAKRPTHVDSGYGTVFPPIESMAVPPTALTLPQSSPPPAILPNKERLTNVALVRQLAKEAQRDGLTLQWSLMHLIEVLAKNQGQLAYQQAGTGEEDLSLRIDSQALALLILAAMNGLPADADLTL